MTTGRFFADLHKGGLGGVATAIVHAPVTVVDSLIQPKNGAIDVTRAMAVYEKTIGNV